MLVEHGMSHCALIDVERLRLRMTRNVATIAMPTVRRKHLLLQR